MLQLIQPHTNSNAKPIRDSNEDPYPQKANQMVELQKPHNPPSWAHYPSMMTYPYMYPQVLPPPQTHSVPPQVHQLLPPPPPAQKPETQPAPPGTELITSPDPEIHHRTQSPDCDNPKNQAKMESSHKYSMTPYKGKSLLEHMSDCF